MENSELIIEGRNAIIEAFRAGRSVDKLFIQEHTKEGSMNTLIREAKKTKTLIKYVPKERLDQISETGHHQGAVAFVAAYNYAEIDDLFAKAEEKGFLCAEIPEQQRREDSQGKEGSNIAEEHDDGVEPFPLPESLDVVGNHPQGDQIQIAVPAFPGVVDHQISPQPAGLLEMIAGPQYHGCQTKQAQDVKVKHSFPQGGGDEPLGIQRPMAVGIKTGENERCRNADAEEVAEIVGHYLWVTFFLVPSG